MTTTIRIGAPFLEGQVLWPEGVVFAPTPTAHTLALFLDEPTSAQIESVRSGAVDLALTLASPALIFMCRFAGGIGWSDAAYNPHRYGNAPAAPSRLVRTLNVALVDAAGGTVRAIRTVEIPVYFAEELVRALRALDASEWPGEEKFARYLDALYASSTSEELAERADVTCTIA